MLAYVTIIPAIIFLIDRALQQAAASSASTAFQSIFFAIAWTALWIVLSFVAHIPFLGWLTILIWPLDRTRRAS
jgi:hypothetical protein